MTRHRIARSLRLLVPGVLLLSGLACRPAEREVERVEELDQILAAVPDEQMRNLWLEAAREGRLPDLSALPVPAEPLAVRTRVVVEQPARKVEPPVIPEGAVAALLPFSSEPLAEFEGGYRITETRPGLIVGSLVEGPERFELHYKLPAQSRLRLPETAELVLSFQDRLVAQSHRRLVQLAAAEDPNVFLYLSDGGPEPYDRTFDKLGLRVRQGGPDEENQPVAPVIVSSGRGREVSLLPGEVGRLDDGYGELEVFVQSSFYSTDPGARLLEGDPFHVVVMIYRPQ